MKASFTYNGFRFVIESERILRWTIEQYINLYIEKPRYLMRNKINLVYSTRWDNKKFVFSDHTDIPLKGKIPETLKLMEAWYAKHSDGTYSDGGVEINSTESFLT